MIKFLASYFRLFDTTGSTKLPLRALFLYVFALGIYPAPAVTKGCQCFSQLGKLLVLLVDFIQVPDCLTLEWITAGNRIEAFLELLPIGGG